MSKPDIKEQEANYFAMHLLIPTVRLKECLDLMEDFDLLGDEKKTKKLARIFKVPVNIMTIRLADYYYEDLA